MKVYKRKARFIVRPWTFVGDFNDILLYSENQGGRMKEIRKIKCFLRNGKFFPIKCAWFNGQKFTWFGIRKGILIKGILDMVLVNLE